MKVDHVGYAVARLDLAIPAFEALGYIFDEIVPDVARNVQLAFGSNGSYRVELIAPLNASEKSPVDAYLNKLGPTPYHIAYLSDNWEVDLALLHDQGFRVVIPAAPAVAFGGRRVVFMASAAVGLIELVEATGTRC